MPNRNKIYEDAPKADIFTYAITKQFKNHPGQELKEVDDSLSIIRNDRSISVNYVTTRNVWEIVRKLPSGKAPGHDGISNITYKKLPKVAIVFLANIYMTYLRHAYFPRNRIKPS